MELRKHGEFWQDYKSYLPGYQINVHSEYDHNDVPHIIRRSAQLYDMKLY